MAQIGKDTAGAGRRFVDIGAKAPQRNLSRVAPEPPFTFCFHPNQWHADLTLGRVLPSLVKVSGLSGVNGATEQDPQAGMYSMVKQGFVPIDMKVTADMPGGPESYLVATDVRRGVYYSTPWVTPVPGSDRVTVDAEGHRAFVAWLVDSGNVPKLEVHVIDDKLARLKRLHTEARRKATTDPIAAERAAQIGQEIDIWRAAKEPAPLEVPEIKPRRTRKVVAPKE